MWQTEKTSFWSLTSLNFKFLLHCYVIWGWNLLEYRCNYNLYQSVNLERRKDRSLKNRIEDWVTAKSLYEWPWGLSPCVDCIFLCYAVVYVWFSEVEILIKMCKWGCALKFVSKYFLCCFPLFKVSAIKASLETAQCSQPFLDPVFS